MVDAAAATVDEDSDDGARVVGGRESDVAPFCEAESFSGWNKYKIEELVWLKYLQS